MRKLTIAFFFAFGVILLSVNSFAQDATIVDPDHYKVEFENDQVRVLRINYGPGEKGEMHSHPEGVVIFLNDGKRDVYLP